MKLKHRDDVVFGFYQQQRPHTVVTSETSFHESLKERLRNRNMNQSVKSGLKPS